MQVRARLGSSSPHAPQGHTQVLGVPVRASCAVSRVCERWLLDPRARLAVEGRRPRPAVSTSRCRMLSLFPDSLFFNQGASQPPWWLVTSEQRESVEFSLSQAPGTGSQFTVEE